MIYLKQSTASQEISLGPFVDSADGVTPETGLTIANTDVKIFKAGASAYASKNSGGATHDASGNYTATLDATDTNTLGSGKIMVQVAGALPVWDSFVVLAANVFDALIGGGDLLQVDTTEWKGATAPAMTGDAFARLGAPAGASVSADVAAVKAETASIQTDTNDIQTRLPAALVSGRMDSSVGAMAANVMTAAAAAADLTTELQSGLATAAALATVDTVVDAIQAKTDNLPTDPADQSLIIAATDAVMARLGAPAGASMSADVAAVKTQTAAIEVDTADIQTRLPVALVSGRIDASIGAAAANVLTAAALASDAVAEIADAVWDEPLAGHVVAGSTGAELDAAASAGDPWATDLPGAYGAGTAGALVAAIEAKTTNLPADPADASVVAAATDAITAAVATRLAASAYTAPLDAAGTRAAVGMAAANLDTQLVAIKAVDDAVKVKTDQLTFTTGVVHADSKRVAGVVLEQNGSGTQSIGGPA